MAKGDSQDYLWQSKPAKQRSSRTVLPKICIGTTLQECSVKATGNCVFEGAN
jgi:hypothetical protein